MKSGAALVTCAEDIITVLAPQLGRESPLAMDLDDRDEQVFPPPESVDIRQGHTDQVAEALGPVPVEVDEVIRATGLTARQVQGCLLALDMAGRLTRHGGQRVSLSPTNGP